MEDDMSRKLVISVIAILVITLATNNFLDLTGQPVKPIQKAVIKTCIDKDKGVDDIYTPSYASYSDGSRVVYDKCWSSRILDEANCVIGIPMRQGANCLNGCRNNACLKNRPLW